MGVLTRSKILSLQKFQKDSVEFLQLGNKRFKKQSRGSSSNLSKGKRKSGTGRTRNDVEVEKGGVKLEEGVNDDLGVVNLVGGGGGGGIDIGGGGPPAVVGDVVEDVGGEATNGGDDLIVGGGDGGEGDTLGGDVINGDNVSVNGGNDRETCESTHKYPALCSSTKEAKAVADEWPQTELETNLYQHPSLTTDLLLQENSNYAPSMERYNFDFENENPLPGRFKWEKVRP